MYENIFKRYRVDELYVGLVTVFKTKCKKPSFVKVNVPNNQNSVQYITLLRKEKNTGNIYIQLDNEQICFGSNNSHEYSNFPKVSNLIPLSKFYKNYYHKNIKQEKCFMTLKKSKRIINKAEKVKTVIL